jgi:hypothetical protein
MKGANEAVQAAFGKGKGQGKGNKCCEDHLDWVSLNAD